MIEIEPSLKIRKNIILIGFMGSGKTSVGGKLARARHYHFLDTDQILEEEFGCSIREYFEQKGEEEFRRQETNLMRRLSLSLRGCVLSTGGGLPLREENRSLLRETGVVIYLRASEETTMERLMGDTTRPLLAGEDLSEKVHRLLGERRPIYEKAAHYTLDTDKKSFYEIIKEIQTVVMF